MSPIYPDLNSMRRNSENYEKTPGNPKTPSNCTKILTKGPLITKDILEKMQHPELGAKNTYICGRDIKTRRLWVLSGLVVLLSLSLAGTIIMWFTDQFDKAVLSNLVLTKGTQGFALWNKPPAKPLLKMHLFNYTNVEDFENGNAEKLRVKDIGPYVYEMTFERVNLVFNDNGTVTYQEKRSYQFLPELSRGYRQSDRVIVPNMPMLGAAARAKHSFYLSRLALSSLLKSLNAKPFLSLPAHRFIWGYDDSLYTLAKGILALKNEILYERFGILSYTNGTSNNVVTINTGEKDINKLGMIDEYNGGNSIGHWSTEECNAIRGTDGTIFPPHMIRQKQNLSVYHKDMCRILPFTFQKEVKLFNGKVPAYKYVLPDTVFDRPEIRLENQCYCDMESGSCPPQGIFNATPCAFGAPAFLSFPHFYMGSQELKEGVLGIQPNPKEHETFLYAHPKLGYAMSGKTRFQMNIQVIKSFGISQMDMFEDKLMLPIAWFELGLEDKDVPQEALNIIYLTTFTVRGIEAALQYGCLFTAILTLIMLIIELKGRWQSRDRTDSNSSTIHLQTVTEI